MKRCNRRKRAGGFTLIEMLVVIVIILILSGVVLRVATLAGRKGATSRCEAQLQQLANALSAYAAEYGRYPPGTGDDPGRNTQYEYECAPSQTAWFRQTYLPQRDDPHEPDEFFPDIIPENSDRKGWPYEDMPRDHWNWGLGYRYGLVAHLWPRENPLDVTGVPGGDGGSGGTIQSHWYDEDTDRDLAAKRRWAVMLEGIGLSVGWSEEYEAPRNANAGRQTWINCVARILDPWENNYRYICRPPFLSYELWSMGPDERDGTPDDIYVRN